MMMMMIAMMMMMMMSVWLIPPVPTTLQSSLHALPNRLKYPLQIAIINIIIINISIIISIIISLFIIIIKICVIMTQDESCKMQEPNTFNGTRNWSFMKRVGA